MSLFKKDTAAQDQHAHKREKLPMEIKFDKWVYGGISYWAQTLTGMGVTYWMKYGSGKPIFAKASEWAGKNLMNKITSKTGAAAIEEAHTTIAVSTMIMVGNVFLLPVKWLENRKPQIVRKWTEDENKKLAKAGTPVSQETKNKQERLLKELEEDPIQNWWSLLGGRAFGLAAVYATAWWGIGDKNNKKIAGFLGDTVSKGLEGAGFTKAAKAKPLHGITEMVFLDSFYSAISAGGLYVYSHYVNPPKKSSYVNLKTNLPNNREKPIARIHYQQSKDTDEQPDHYIRDVDMAGHHPEPMGVSV